MTKLAATIAVALALTARAAFGEQEHPPAPASPPSGPQTPWTGYHVGLDGGYAWDPNIYTAAYPVQAGIDNRQTSFPGGFYPGITHSGASALSATGMVHPNVGGFIGGGQFGYDYQFGNSVVVGIEADFQGALVRGRRGFRGAATTLFFDAASCSAGCTNTVTSFVDNEKSVDWLGTVRGRVGYLATPTLLAYATGGLAYGGVTAGTSIAQEWVTNYALTSPGAVGHFADTRVGWTVGGGVEWLFLPNWSAKVEYLHYDLGSIQFTSSPLVTIFPVGTFPCCTGEPTVFNVVIPRTYTRFYGEIVRVGLNYHFDLGALLR